MVIHVPKVPSEHGIVDLTIVIAGVAVIIVRFAVRQRWHILVPGVEKVHSVHPPNLIARACVLRTLQAQLILNCSVVAHAARDNQAIHLNVFLHFHSVVGEQTVMLGANFVLVHCAELHVVVEAGVALCQLVAGYLEGVVNAVSWPN